MIEDYSSFGAAYRNFKVRKGVFVPEPPEEFSADDPFTRMAPIRGELKDIQFDETYPYLDKSLKFKIWHFFIYLVTWIAAFPMNRLRFGLKIEGREKIRRNRKLFANGVMTLCNHVHRWDMICVLQAMRYRKAWIPMYAQPFRGKDGFLMKHIGGIAIPENYAGLRKFDQALDELHKEKQWIHISLKVAVGNSMLLSVHSKSGLSTWLIGFPSRLFPWCSPSGPERDGANSSARASLCSLFTWETRLSQTPTNPERKRRRECATWPIRLCSTWPVLFPTLGPPALTKILYHYESYN